MSRVHGADYKIFRCIKQQRDNLLLVEKQLAYKDPLTTSMESLESNPIWYALSDLATSTHTEANISNLLRQLGGEGTAEPMTEAHLGGCHRTLESIKEDRSMLVASVLVSLDASSGPTSFSAWAVQGGVDSAIIWGIYASRKRISFLRSPHQKWGTDVIFHLFIKY